MKQKMSLIVLTKRVGYQLPQVRVNVQFHFETVPNDLWPDLLGDTYERIVFDRFDIDGTDLAGLVAEYSAAASHLEDLVREYIRTGDTLNAGAGLLGGHQIVYQPDTSAYLEHLRCEEFKARRVSL